MAVYNDIVAAWSSYVGRVRNDHHFEAEATREVSAEAAAAGVLEDAIGRMYCALIACLLIQLACPFKPDQWTYKLLCLHQQGWATEEEVLEHLRQRAETAQQPQ